MSTATTPISLKEIAELFGVSSETVRAWRKDGFPTREARGDGRGISFVPAACVAWRIEQQAERFRSKLTASERDQAYVDRQHVRRMIDELTLSALRGEMVTVADYEEELGKACDVMRQGLLSLPSRLAPQVVGMKTVAAAQVAVQLVVDALMEDLSRHDPTAPQEKSAPQKTTKARATRALRTNGAANTSPEIS